MIFNILGDIVLSEACLLVLPLIVSLIYGESCYSAFLITIGIALIIGLLLRTIFRSADETIFAKDGFVIVALSWIFMSLIGALPFTISGEIPSYIDAFFETVSGFTTTGASVIPDVEALSRGMLFWRSFTHWVGGMGVLVFVMAIIPSVTDRSIHILRAEMPGPIVGKLVPRARETAKILYYIYLGMTALEVILLLVGGMPVFDSFVHTFGTAGTGGFGIKGDSLASYSPYLQWIITIFMLLFGVNFNLYYLILMRKIKAALKSEELRVYLILAAISIIVVTANIYPMYKNFSDAFRNSSFQIASLISTTGYSTANFDTWPSLSKAILIFVMFTGACAGSTAGGLKMSRIMILWKTVKNDIKKMMHPRSIITTKFEGKTLDDTTVRSTMNYFGIYTVAFAAILLVITFDGFNFETNFTAVLACINNIGPGLQKVGPSLNFNCYSPIPKIVLSFAMLLGRLELYPMIILFTPSLWAPKHKIKK